MEKNENKKVKWQKLTNFIHDLGKFIIDAAKLCFGSLVLGSVIKGDISYSMLLNVGIIASAAGAVIGILMVIFTKEK